MCEEITGIREIVNRFRAGYLNRDPDALESFMDLFCDGGILEVIGTDAYIKGQGEWSRDKAALRRMIAGDWESWGNLRLDNETEVETLPYLGRHPTNTPKGF